MRKIWFQYGTKTPDVITYDEAVNIGDNIQTETEYKGNIKGRVIKQTFNLNGNIIIKDSVVR